ncbi:hypothetical protein D9C73_003568 [Collichthys lucidus]|uniref:Uncharacterized protein n=1 Tax=Collichthys lucidus TaxID=240159 RepID=A0A4U5U5I7_COLLU|nr:hypothetical protein D9C73_003568 [Collichthys lucidus]
MQTCHLSAKFRRFEIKMGHFSESRRSEEKINGGGGVSARMSKSERTSVYAQNYTILSFPAVLADGGKIAARMRDLGVKDAIIIKQLDAGLRCSWSFAWLDLQYHVEVKGKEREFLLSDVFRKIEKVGHARCILCHKEINYGNKGSHALLAHCKTELHKKKVCDLSGTHNIASLLASDAGPSTSAPNQGPENIRQQCQPKLPTPIASRIANSEAMVLGVLAERSLPFSIAPVIVELAQTLALDKEALQGMKLSRTAAAYKMVYGLGRTYSDRTLSYMRSRPFSLNIDESTTTKSYYHDGLKKVLVEHLGTLEILKGTAASLERELCQFFEQNNIPWKNLVSILMDSCAVMRGSKTGLETRIQQHCPGLLDIDGDSCHHMHNCAKKFAEPFERHLEQLFSDLQMDHQWCPDQVQYFKETCLLMSIPASSPQRGFVNDRWLSAYDASMSTFRMLPAYEVLYYGYLSVEDQELYQEPLEALYTKYSVREYFTTLSPRALVNLVLEDHMVLPARQMYVGQDADTFRTNTPNHAAKLPLDSQTLKALSALDPLLRGHSQGPIQLKRLSGMLNHLLPTGCDVHQEILKFSVDLALPVFREGDCFVEWVESAFSLMNKVLDNKSGNMNITTCDAIQTVKYNHLARGKSAVELFRRENVRYGEVDRVLCKNIQTAGTTDKCQRQQHLKKAECGVLQSATASRAEMADKEKQARLRHAAKHRKRACEILVQAKKKKT